MAVRTAKQIRQPPFGRLLWSAWCLLGLVVLLQRDWLKWWYWFEFYPDAPLRFYPHLVMSSVPVAFLGLLLAGILLPWVKHQVRVAVAVPLLAGLGWVGFVFASIGYR